MFYMEQSGGYMKQTLKREGISQDEITEAVSSNFDYDFNGVSECQIPSMPPHTKDFGIGLIVGPSGSGKSTLLKQYGCERQHQWEDDKAIVSHFFNAEDAQNKLSAVGLNSVPAWFRPYAILSTGEKYRADLARSLGDGAVIDEFTSVVDRSVAKSCSSAIHRYIKKHNLKSVVFASCHYDIIDWLRPDWVFDTLTGEYLPRGSLRQPTIELELLPCGPEAWTTFSHHHYLSENINKSARHWICLWGSNVVGFASAISMPSGTLKKAFRGHRTVVLPDYQGLGLGVRISDAVGEIHLSEGKRYFSKTTHPRMGAYRNKSDKWRATSKNMKVRGNAGGNKNLNWDVRKVFSYSHEYLGG
jgi:GNAT superfamily N-acetyltransferase